MHRKILLSLVIFTVLGTLKKPVFAQEGTWTRTKLDNLHISSLEIASWGILAAENDSRLWSKPFNGIYISKDLGNSWQKLGLPGKGITKVKHHDGKIYASNYYAQNGIVGLYISEDTGNTWQYAGNGFSATSVEANDTTIFLGGVSHGLWISQDGGDTWEQKIGDGWFGPRIDIIEASGNLVVATTQGKTYRSTDMGNTWQEIEMLDGKTIKGIGIHDNVVLVGTNASTGLYRSTDYGETWAFVENWGNYPAGDITYFQGYFYAGKLTQELITYSVYKSSDLGLTWANTGLNIANTSGNITNIKGLFSKPSLVYALVPTRGVYKHVVPEVIEKFPFLETPWAAANTNEFIDKTTSFFDHKYPLLGYGYHTEPEDAKDKILNYLGLEQSEPDMYYSTHDGYDYALSYGTEIRAPAPGYATYAICDACGHTIQIDHQNGYRTTYMHLQENRLLTKDQATWVDTNNLIGLVGMTGNTTGPHLHFSIMQDSNQNGIFDDFPQGKVDPYGWQVQTAADPWEIYNWTDVLGTHQGGKSMYLWNNNLAQSAKYINDVATTVVIDNKQLDIPKTALSQGATVIAQNYNTPTLPVAQKLLKYVPKTSLIIDIIDHFGHKITDLDNNIRIEIDLTNIVLENIIQDTLSIYFWNEERELWEPIPTIIDFTAKKITGEIDHLSRFAVFGQKIDTNTPQTNLILEGTMEDTWFTEHPTIYLESSEAADIFYTTENDLWNEYTQPLIWEKEGITTFEYRSIDAAQNIESVQKAVIKVDTQNSFSKNKVKIIDSTFNLQ